MSIDSNTPPSNWLSDTDELVKMFAATGLRMTAAHPVDDIITNHPTIIEHKDQLRLLSNEAFQESIILIRGQSGAGKELYARALHGPMQENSKFLAVNMAGLPESLASSILQGHRAGTFTGALQDRPGIFEAASKLHNSTSAITPGTVFLDEIGDMPLAQQALLLRILDTREVLPIGGDQPKKINCRIIAATNADLEKMMAAGTFRKDLYARLMEIEFKIPPWPERFDDILLLAQHFGMPEDIANEFLMNFNTKKLEDYGARYIKAAAANYKRFKRLTLL